MTSSDLAEVVKIEQKTISPWGEKQFVDELVHPASWLYVARLAKGQTVIGYICGRKIEDEAEIFRLAVSQDCRRQGVGKELLAYALGILRGEGAKRFFLELRDSNGPALALYKSSGFQVVGLRKGYYHGPSEDAILMTVNLDRGEGS